MRYIFPFLLLLFAIEDLIGRQNVKKLETLWLATATSIFQSWQLTVRKSFIWWRILILLLIILLAIASILSLLINFVHDIQPYILTLQAYELPPTLLKKAGSFLGMIVMGTAGWISYGALTYFFEYFLLSSPRVKPPIEVYILKLILEILKFIADKRDLWASMFTGAVMTFLIMVFGLAAPYIILPILLSKCAFFIVFFTTWAVVFAPSKMFQAIARRTGGDSYIKVAKYIITAIAAVWSLSDFV